MADFDENKQLVVIETKCDLSKDHVIFDIHKLSIMINPNLLKFKIGIFIAIGSTEHILKQKIQEILNCTSLRTTPTYISIFEDICKNFPNVDKQDFTENALNYITQNLYFIATHSKENEIGPSVFRLLDL